MSKGKIHSQCQAAKPYYYDYICGQQEQVPGEISIHIADCADCQQEVQWLRQADTEADEFSVQTLETISHTAQMELHCALINRPVRCSDVKAFLPILAMPAASVGITTPVTAHIQACEQCSGDLTALKELNLSSEQLSCLSQLLSQKQTDQFNGVNSVTDTFFRGSTPLQATLRKIMDRPDSGVVTCFRSKDNPAPANGRPYHAVMVNDMSGPSAGPASRPVRVRTAPSRLKWWFKPAAAAAAAAVIGLFLFRGSSVNATDIGQIYEALKSVQNVVMAEYDVDNPEPVQQISISRSRGIKLLQTGSQFVLYDIKNGAQKTITPGQPPQQIRLDSDTIKSVSKTMNIPYGLLPFKSVSELPEGAVWKKVESNGNIANPDRTEIYDLFWSEQPAGPDSAVHYHWRCHLDPVTKHPLKLELWTKGPLDLQYNLITTTEVTYPTQEQMGQIIDKAGF